MDYQNQKFYKLNKNTSDLIYNFANETITYQKEQKDNGTYQIIEIKKSNSNNKTLRRIVPPSEMTVEEFDIWKKQLTQEAHEYQNKDARETRNNVNIDDLLETDLVSDESLEDEYFSNLTTNEIQNKKALAFELWRKLTPIQRRRFFMYKAQGKTLREIANEEGVDHKAVLRSITLAERKLQKEIAKRKNIF